MLVGDLTRPLDGGDGEWRTLDGAALYAHAKSAGYLYQAHLRHDVRALPYRRQDVALDAERLGDIAERLLGPDGLTRHASTFAGRDVVRAWCEHLPAGAHADHIEALTDGSSAAVATLLAAGPAEPRFTSREVLAVEHRLISSALDPRHERVDTMTFASTPPRDTPLILLRRCCGGRGARG